MSYCTTRQTACVWWITFKINMLTKWFFNTAICWGKTAEVDGKITRSWVQCIGEENNNFNILSECLPSTFLIHLFVVFAALCNASIHVDTSWNQILNLFSLSALHSFQTNRNWMNLSTWHFNFHFLLLSFAYTQLKMKLHKRENQNRKKFFSRSVWRYERGIWKRRTKGSFWNLNLEQKWTKEKSLSRTLFFNWGFVRKLGSKTN